ncbi:MAG: kinase/pyrophosphorylase [Bacteroidales bacterium]|nr:kinase/pyrophosphorylase [Bacteroidales bacterium]MBN2819568.1 kinase/pyrophosphorylase [Bacteroidales bacterium]
MLNIDKPFPIYVISGGKGLAGHTMVHSLIIQYPDDKLNVNVIPNVQSDEKIIEVVQKVKKAGGLLTHTMVNSTLRRRLIMECEKQGVREIDFMGQLSDFLEEELGFKSINVPGLYRRINSQYFDRIEAMEYTLNHDDGLNPGRLHDAEIVLTGVSRSGKTPLSVYMSMFGWKVANVPLVKGIDPPKELFEINPQRVFGLSINSSHLISQRHKRLSQMGDFDGTNYIDQQKVRQELQFANLVFERGGFTKINVTNKPVETSANEIIGLISDRFSHDERKHQKPEDS